MDIRAVTAEKKRAFDEYLQSYLARHRTGSALFDACAYSLKAGGKRLRPVLAMLSCEASGGRAADALPAALAIEMIHTFSLIHDDLPALDNDELRRGMPTCHARFGEATAILAGDALIFEAMSVIGASACPPEVRLDLLTFMAEAVRCLVEGEHLDVMAEGKSLSLTEIEGIYRKKTSRLFELCMFAGSRIGGADAEQTARLVEYGTCLGLAFQAIDDILDMTASNGVLGKTTGKDLIQDKATIVKAIGIEGASQWAREMTNRAVQGLGGFGNGAASSLREIAFEMLGRVM